ncbi:hypothetical protein C8J57DRAFT_1221668 [Mycena rebaudengoi]|nr:hypothetical protein C8J57DRAFT_1221668 [Mycena rebaudengoi]
MGGFHREFLDGLELDVREAEEVLGTLPFIVVAGGVQHDRMVLPLYSDEECTALLRAPPLATSALYRRASYPTRQLRWTRERELEPRILRKPASPSGRCYTLCLRARGPALMRRCECRQGYADGPLRWRSTSLPPSPSILATVDPPSSGMFLRDRSATRECHPLRMQLGSNVFGPLGRVPGVCSGAQSMVTDCLETTLLNFGTAIDVRYSAYSPSPGHIPVRLPVETAGTYLSSGWLRGADGRSLLRSDALLPISIICFPTDERLGEGGLSNPKRQQQIMAVYISEAEKYDMEGWKSDMGGPGRHPDIYLSPACSQRKRQYLLGSSHHSADHLSHMQWAVVHRLTRFSMHALVVEVVPLLFHASLLLFLAGLVAFPLPVNRIIMGVAARLLALLVLIYRTLTILPIFYLDCPFRNPLSSALWRLLRALPPKLRWASAKDATLAVVEAMVTAATGKSDERATRDLRALIWAVKSLADEPNWSHSSKAYPTSCGVQMADAVYTTTLTANPDIDLMSPPAASCDATVVRLIDNRLDEIVVYLNKCQTDVLSGRLPNLAGTLESMVWPLYTTIKYLDLELWSPGPLSNFEDEFNTEAQPPSDLPGLQRYLERDDEYEWTDHILRMLLSLWAPDPDGNIIIPGGLLNGGKLLRTFSLVSRYCDAALFLPAITTRLYGFAQASTLNYFSPLVDNGKSKQTILACFEHPILPLETASELPTWLMTDVDDAVLSAHQYQSFVGIMNQRIDETRFLVLTEFLENCNTLQGG